MGKHCLMPHHSDFDKLHSAILFTLPHRNLCGHNPCDGLLTMTER